MESRSWHLLPLLFTALLFGFVVFSHEGIWNQDPFIHEEYYIHIAETGNLHTDNPLVKDSLVNYFPPYHIIMAGMKDIFGLTGWELYRLSYVIFPLFSVYLIFKLGENMFGYTEGIISASLLATSFMFLAHLYEVGLTYNLFMINLALFTFYCTMRTGIYWRLATVLSAFFLTFSHPLSFIFLVILIVQKRNDKPVVASLALFILYPIWTEFTFLYNLDTLSFLRIRNPLGTILQYALNRGIFFILNLGFQFVFLGYGIRYSIRKKDGFLGLWIFLLTLIWVTASIPFIRATGDITLFETDRFLFYLVFPAAVAGGLFINRLKLYTNEHRLLLFIVIASFLYPSLVYTHETMTRDFPFEKSRAGLIVLDDYTSSQDIVITTQATWVNLVAETRGYQMTVTNNGVTRDLLKSPTAYFSKVVASEEGFFKEIEPLGARYIFLSYQELLESPHVAGWFRGHRNRFEIVYDDGNSMIVRIVYCDRHDAQMRAAALLGGDINKVKGLDIVPIDNDPNYIGNESWEVRYYLGNDTALEFTVNKETCGIMRK